MSNHTDSRGLPGLIAGTRAGISRLFDKPELWLVRSIIVASIISVVYYSGDKAKDLPTQAILIFFGLAAVGFHFVGAKKACRAWFERQGGAFLAWCLVICGAVAWEMNSQIGIASNNQANLSTAALNAHIKSDDVRKSVADAEAKVDRLRERIKGLEPIAGVANVKPWATPQQAEAAVKTAEAHRYFVSTDGCKATSGPKTRDFCAAYQNAKAEVARWNDLRPLYAELAIAEGDAKEARIAASSVSVIATAERADMRNLKRLTALSDADIELSQSILVVAVMALFLTVAGWLIKAEEYEGKPRRPWFRGAIRARMFAWATGNYESIAAAKAAGGAVIVREVEKTSDEALAIMASVGRRLQAA